MPVNKTLTDLITSRRSEETRGIYFILSTNEEYFVSYKDLYYNSLRFLNNIQSEGFKQGDEVVFQLDNNEKFIYSFWACVLGGMVPVPLTPGTNDEHKLKLFKVWDVLNNPKIITTRVFIAKLRNFAQRNGFGNQMDTIEKKALYEEDALSGDKFGRVFGSEPEDIALVQFSSGSTGDPKGVIITHKNVLVNLSSAINRTNIDSNDVILNWMPLTHDMGLIGTHIKGILACIDQYNIATDLFIRHPRLWLQKASEHKVTLLYSPNFGYKHFLKLFKVEDSINLDLSSVRLIFNGAEPISLSLCQEFLERMSRYGLKNSAMYPVYGLAEGTIGVVLPYPGEPLRSANLNREHLKIGEEIIEVEKDDPRSVTFVDVGYSIHNCYLRICDEENNDLGEKRIGYIQIKGDNVTSGYYNNKDATLQTMTPDGWLSTGDLGFIREGRLVVTGRSKDIIFVDGQNFYSHDIETVAECAEGVELGKVVAIGAFNDTMQSDELVLFVLFKQRIGKFVPIAINAKNIIGCRMGIEVSQVIPIKSIPKTTSGKVQRYKLREAYISGEFDEIKRNMSALLANDFYKRKIDIPENEIEEKLVKMWSEILSISKVGIHDNFFMLGGNSLKVTQLISRIRDEFNIELEQAILFENADIAKLSEAIQKTCEYNKKSLNTYEKSFINHNWMELSNKNHSIKRLEQGKEFYPLSAAQKRMYILSRIEGEGTSYNVPGALIIEGKLSVKRTEEVFKMLIDRHESLRTSFEIAGDDPIQKIHENVDFKVTYTKSEEGKADRIIRKFTRPFDLSRAPLMRVEVVELSDNKHMILVDLHHIISDGTSMWILRKEFVKLYKGQDLPELPIQYKDFSQWHNEFLNSETVAGQENFWLKTFAGNIPLLNLPTDYERPRMMDFQGDSYRYEVDEELTEKLKKLVYKSGSTLFMMVFASYNVLLARLTGQEDIVIGTPVAGRNHADTENLIGVFLNTLALRNYPQMDKKFLEFLSDVKANTIKAFDNQDYPLEKLVEQLKLKREPNRNPLFDVVINSQSTLNRDIDCETQNSFLRFASSELDKNTTKYDIVIILSEDSNKIRIKCEYKTSIFKRSTIKYLMGEHLKLLEEIAENPDKCLKDYDIFNRKHLRARKR